MRRLKHIDTTKRLTAFLLGLIYSLALIGQATHQHDVEFFSIGHNSQPHQSIQSNGGDKDADSTSSEVYLVSNLECHICDFHLGITDQCAVAPSFAVEEWDETPQTTLIETVHPAPRTGKALRAPPVRYC